ncbi:MAG: phytoene/squalene synthase family protein [Acidobacteria bacterium]|nr:MAG: phytoene/squalene synthase family protein [Acidobacteriota bacterium]
MATLAESYSFCRRVARSRAKNFYYSFVLLPREQRNAMCAIYAFMRYCDDLSDEPGASLEPLERWRCALVDALGGKFDAYPAWPAFFDTVQRYRIPHEYFFQVIEGVKSDLEPRRLATFDELYRYCYQVASVVGLTIIHVFGFDSPEALPLAEKCGVAFQLTNILRDIGEDAARGRFYLPTEDLERFGVSAVDLAAGRRTDAIVRLMQFQAARARAYYDESRPLIDLVDKRSCPGLRALIRIYSRLLERIEACNYDVFSRRVSLSSLEKCWIVLRAWTFR